jgi:hypothetical protein
MRGRQSGFGIERVDIDAPPNLQVQYVSVLALLSCYLALVLTSVFIMDWFYVGYSYGARQSVDLWAATMCDSPAGCVSAPLERAGFAGIRPFAVLALWFTALSSAALLVRTGAFLFGLRVSRRVSTIASILLGVSTLCVLAMVFAMPTPSPDNATVQPSFAPFMLVAAQVIGLLAIGLEVRDHRAPAPDRGGGVPRAHVVQR